MVDTKPTLNLFSWNVNGLRAVLRKAALQDFLTKKSPDILCLQEIKCQPQQILKQDLTFLEQTYNIFWNPAERPGYSGTATLVKKDLEQPQEIINNPIDSLAEEGRVQLIKFSTFSLVNVYTPNSKADLSRLPLRETNWDPAFLNLLKTTEQTAPVLSCGDFNAAHQEIDLARPAQNHHSAGFTDQERQGITNLLQAGFLDTFRTLHPNTVQYTWWSARQRARQNNVGWRIDYFFSSHSLKSQIKEAKIYDQVLGSDHCPISITLQRI